MLYTDDGDRVAAKINDNGIGAAAVLVRRASLEDVFLILTGRTLEEHEHARGRHARRRRCCASSSASARSTAGCGAGSRSSTFLNPLLFLAAMGLGLGGLIDETSGSVGGVSYLDFVAPGLMIASAVQLAAGESLWPVVAGVKWIRFYHGIVATPLGGARRVRRVRHLERDPLHDRRDRVPRWSRQCWARSLRHGACSRSPSPG